MASVENAAGGGLSKSDIRLVIAASSAGTLFEWYDFFIYGTLASLIARAFFPADNETLSILLVWAGFAIGFGFRPLGAILFGFLGDRLGRKYTFLVTVTIMGIATAGVGLVPGASSIGLAAPAIVLLLRILQGLALGGEYGGAAIYVAEHAPPERRGLYTSFIQASVTGGFVLSILVVLLCRFAIPPEEFAAWGWRLPFLLSIVLLAISLWMRLKLSESPVFQALKAAGETASNPFAESFTYPGNKRRIVVAFAVTGVLTTVFYSGYFSSLSFLTHTMRMDPQWVEALMLCTGLVSVTFYVLVGNWSDKVGRKLPLIVGGLLTLVAIFPIFWGMGALANPQLRASAANAPVTVVGPNCDFNPFADTQKTDCGKLLQDLTTLGVPYRIEGDNTPRVGNSPFLALQIGQTVHLLHENGDAALCDAARRRQTVRQWLESAGYSFAIQRPPLPNLIGLAVLLMSLGLLSGLTYGSVAAMLPEMFPARIRYSSMSIPYHFGAGYLGGFLPLIAGYIVASTGNFYSGLWYTWWVVAIGLVIAWFGLPGGKPRDFADDPF